MLRLQFDVQETEELCCVWLVAATLLSVWEQRQASNKVQPYIVRAQLEAKINLLRKTRLSNTATLLYEKVEFMFQVVNTI